MSRLHVIEEATFDVSFDAAKTAQEHEPGLSVFVRDRLLPLADEIFCELSGEEATFKLDRLELDLGDIAYQGFQDEMERRFKSMLASALRDRKNAVASLSSANKEKIATPSFAFARLRKFLETGFLEWNALHPNTTEIDQILLAAMRDDGPALVEFLKKTPHRDIVTKRLARQFSERHLLALIELIAVGHGLRVERLANAATIGLQSGAHEGLSAEELKSGLWEQLLAGYLDSSESTPTPEQLVREIAASLSTQLRHRQDANGGTPALRVAPTPPAAPAQPSQQAHASAREIAEEADTTAIVAADRLESPLPASATVGLPAGSEGLDGRFYGRIARRLQGQPGPDITNLIKEAMRVAPASLERLFHQWQSGAIQGSLEFLDGSEVRQLLHAFVGLRHGASNGAASNGPFMRSVEAQASQAKNAAHYYRYVLEQLLREQDVDLDAAAAVAPGQTMGAPAHSRGEHYSLGRASMTSASTRTLHLPSLLDQALTQGYAGALDAIWKECRRHHADLIREAFARHMGEDIRVRRVAAGFPELLLLELAGLAGRLTAPEITFVEALSRHPMLRRELSTRRNSRFWTYTLGYLHTHIDHRFDLVRYTSGLSQHFLNDGAEVESLLRTLEDVDDIGALHDRLLAETLRKSSRTMRLATQRNGADARAAPESMVDRFPEALSSFSANGIFPAVAVEAYQQVVQRLQGQPGPDMFKAIETMMRTAPASLEHLVRRLQTGEIQGDVEFLTAFEAKQLLHTIVWLRLGEKGEKLHQSIEARVAQAPDAARRYRQLLRHYLQKQRPPEEISVNSGATDSTMRADEATTHIMQRLQGKLSVGGIAHAVEAALRDAPAALERLFRQLQSGEIHGDVGILDADEARQLLRAFVRLNHGERNSGFLRSVEAQALQAGDVAHYYRDMLRRLLRDENMDARVIATGPDLTFPYLLQEETVEGPPGDLASADEFYGQFLLRLQGRPGTPLAEAIAAMTLNAPASLERLFRQLQSGEFQGDMAFLDAAETRQLLHAFVRLRLGEKGEKLLQSIETRVAQAPDAARRYRQLLRHFLQKQGLPEEISVISGAPDASVREDEATRHIVQRLQGHAGIGGIAHVVESALRDAPAKLERLFQQLQSGEIQGDIDILDAEEARQLLHAFVRLNHGKRESGLLRSVEAQAHQAGNLAHYYRDMLLRLLRDENMGAQAAATDLSRNARTTTGAGSGLKSPRLPQAETAQDRSVGAPSASEYYGQLALRLQGRPGTPLTGVIEAMTLTDPASLERLFRQLQSGELKGDMAFLDAAESRQLLHAFARLRLGTKGDALLHSIEERATRAQDAVHHYRAVLKQFLQKQKPDLETANFAAGARLTATPTPDRGQDGSSLDDAPIVMQSSAQSHVFGDPKLGPNRHSDTAGIAPSPSIQPRQFPAEQSAFEVSGPVRDASAQPAKENQTQAIGLSASASTSDHRPEQASPTRDIRHMDDAIRQITQRLRGQSVPSLADVVEAMMHAVPEGIRRIERLFQHLRSGEIPAQVEHLGGDEARQLLRAFVLSRRETNGGDFLLAVETHAVHARDTAHYYRHLLERLLRDENLDLEVAAAGPAEAVEFIKHDGIGANAVSRVPAHRAILSPADKPSSQGPLPAAETLSSSESVAMQGAGGSESTRPFNDLPPDASASHRLSHDSTADRLCRQLARRLRGQPGQDLAHAVEAVTWAAPENAESLERLFQQIQDGKMQGGIDYLSAGEAQQLLHVFVRSHPSEKNEELLRSIQTRAAQANDVARYYRCLLRFSIDYGLDPDSASDTSGSKPALPAGAGQDIAQPRQAPTTTPATSQRGKRPPFTEHESMTSNEMPMQNSLANDVPKSVNRTSQPTDILVANAGLVLAAPYLPHLFNMLELTDGTKFKNERAAERAAHLAQFAVDARCDTPEFQLALNKLLCGIAAATPIVREIQPLPNETEAVESMLRAMIQHWSIIGNTSIQGLRESFLQRNGMLQWREDGWRLKVETRSIDVLIDRLPWSFSIIKSPWMAQPIRVEWR